MIPKSTDTWKSKSSGDKWVFMSYNPNSGGMKQNRHNTRTECSFNNSDGSNGVQELESVSSSSVKTLLTLPDNSGSCIQNLPFQVVNVLPLQPSLGTLAYGQGQSRCRSGASGILTTWHNRVQTCLYHVCTVYIPCYSTAVDRHGMYNIWKT